MSPFRLAQLFIAINAAAFINSGCSHNDGAAMKQPQRSQSKATDKYVLEVMEPPVGGTPRVEATYDDGLDQDPLSMTLVENKPNSFEVQLPRGSQVQFSVWVDFDQDQCHNPKDEFYCGPVRLSTNNAYYSQSGDVEEVNVVLKASMSSAVKDSEIEYDCDDGTKTAQMGKWQPRFCKYELLNPVEF